MGSRAFGGAVAILWLAMGCGDTSGLSEVDAGVSCRAHADCDDGLYCNGVERCEPATEGADALGCVPGLAPCDGATCREATRACSTCEDADGDGRGAIHCGGDDCDDTDPNRFPGNPEVCDADDHDEDCDAMTFGVRDLDGDFVPDAACCNESAGGSRFCGSDCDDTRGNVSPSTSEVCDRVDNDCDGLVDEGVRRSFWPDVDGDGFGDEGATPTLACTPPGVAFAERAGDCDDTNAFAHDTAAPEVCDGEDNDCDLDVDEETAIVSWYVDVDRDGWGDSALAAVQSCIPVTNRVTVGGDCDDENPAVNPGAVEACNEIDDDCDTDTDENTRSTVYRDADMDLFGDPNETLSVCPQFATPGYVARAGDCDDSDVRTYPAAPEICDLVFNDCTQGSGARPEEDDDGDSYGDRAECDATVVRGGLLPGSDCDDTDATVRPGGAASSVAFCPDNLFACTGCTGRGRCGAEGCSCDEGIVDASYDRDCDGEEEPVGLVANCAAGSKADGGCFSTCVGGGLDGYARPLTESDCGGTVLYRACACGINSSGTSLLCQTEIGADVQEPVLCR